MRWRRSRGLSGDVGTGRYRGLVQLLLSLYLSPFGSRGRFQDIVQLFLDRRPNLSGGFSHRTRHLPTRPPSTCCSFIVRAATIG